MHNKYFKIFIFRNFDIHIFKYCMTTIYQINMQILVWKLL